MKKTFLDDLLSMLSDEEQQVANAADAFRLAKAELEMRNKRAAILREAIERLEMAVTR